MSSRTRYLYLPLVLVVVVSLVACGPFAIGIEDRNLPNPAGNNDSAATPNNPDVAATSEPTTAIEIATPNKTFDVPVTTPTEDLKLNQSGSQYWTIRQDPYGFFRFALPCFWRIGTPYDQAQVDYFAEQGKASFGAYNFPEDYASAFPRGQGIFESGGYKVALEILNASFLGYPAGIGPKEFVMLETNTEQSEIMALEEVTINGQPAVDAQIRAKESNSIWRFYLIQINEGAFLRFFTEPSGKLLETPDVRGMLNSITVSPDANVPLPTHIPDAPPTGVTAACMPPS